MYAALSEVLRYEAASAPPLGCDDSKAGESRGSSSPVAAAAASAASAAAAALRNRSPRGTGPFLFPRKPQPAPKTRHTSSSVVPSAQPVEVQFELLPRTGYIDKSTPEVYVGVTRFAVVQWCGEQCVGDMAGLGLAGPALSASPRRT